LNAKQDQKELDIADADVRLPSVTIADLPMCPKCHEGLLRPGVVWFGESLPSKVLNTVDSFINDSAKIDLIMVIGTSASVYPAAAYVDDAREKGARVAVINADRADEPAGGLDDNDWFFEGDAAQIIPDILKSLIGEVEQPTETL
jgi:NAD-dependent deacetylase sirtuin 5